MNRFIDYFHNGGFPEGALLAAKRNYLTSVYQKIYLGDIAARNAITNTFGLKIMIKKLAGKHKTTYIFQPYSQYSIHYGQQTQHNFCHKIR